MQTNAQGPFKKFSHHSIFEALEDRVLFDGVPDAALIIPDADAQQPIPAQVQDVQQSDTESLRELIIVDPGVENADSLVSEVLENRADTAFEIRILDAGRDGVSQISEILDGSQQYDAVHIISHGEQGQIQLGNSALNSENLKLYTDQISSWSEALTEDADLLFYGCDLAGNEEGESFIKSISAITGADVAASDDVTGNEKLGGDWELEFSVGDIQVRTLQAMSWLGELGPRFYTSGDQGDVITVVDASDTNPATNEEILGPVVNVADVEAIARDPFTGELYGANQNELGIINQDTGEYTTIGTGFGTASSASAGLSGALGPVVATGFDPISGDLYAVAQKAGADWLFKVDTTTGAFVPNAFGAGEDFVLLDTTAAGGGASVDDIAVDNTGQIYITTAQQLLTVNVAGSSATVTALPNTFGSGITDMEGLSSDAQGNIWGSTGSAGAGTANSIWQIDKTTGLASNQIQLDDAGDYEGLEAWCATLDLELTKTTTASSVNVGDQVTFTVTVTNSDPNILAPGVEVTDATPPGMSYVSSTPSKGTFNSATGVWDVGVVAAGTSETLQVTYQVDSLPTTGTTITNTAEISDAHVDDPDSTPDNGVAAEDDQASATIFVEDKDGDGIFNSADLDADNDGILDTNEATVAVDSGVNGAFAASDVTFGITSNSPTTQSEPHYLDSITISGVNGTVDGVYTDLIVPDGYTSNFSTNDPAEVRTVENGVVGTGINDPNYDTDALVTFQDLNLQHFQWLDSHNFSSDTYTLSYNTPVLASSGGFIAFTERGGNNPLQAEAYDAAGNLLGTINLATADYIDTGHAANNFQNIEIALYPIDDLAPVGSQISSIRITLAGNTSDGPDGKVFLYGDPESFSIETDTDKDGVGDNCDLDADNDGISDIYESGSAVGIAADTNNDGTVSLAESLAEMQSIDPTYTGDGDADDDGLMDIFDADFNDPSAAASVGTVPVDTDMDGIYDYLDLDSDNDLIADTIEARPTAGYVANDGDVSDNDDADGDGVIDIHDANDTTTGDYGGTASYFNSPVDTDGDGTADYLDSDSDNDTMSDMAESGLAGSASGTDADGDGIDDGIAPGSYCDPDGIVTNPSSDMGNQFGDTSEVGYREAVADLVTVKTLLSGDATPDEGDTVTFQIVITNNGGAQATNVSLIDQLPAGITYTGNTTTQGTYNSTSGLWTVGTLNNSAMATITLTGTVDVGEGGNTITNTTSAATGDQTDPSTVGDDLVESVTVNDASDLVTVKTLASGDATPAEGDTVTFQIVVTNNGAAQATNVSLTDSMPAGITYTGNTTTQGAYNAATGLWNIGTLNDGATATITLTGTVDVGEGGNTITNVTTAATGDQTDPTTAGDDLDEAVVIDNTTDLVTVKTLASGDATPDEGDTVTFQIQITNNGAAQATNVSLTDSMPAGITYTGNTTTQGSYNAATGLWNIGTLNDGASATITLTGTVDVGEGGNTITNMTSAATGDQTDPTTAGDDLVESVTVNDASDLVTVKTLTSGDATPAEGDTVTFQIVVTNNGAAQATNVSLTDSMPTGITYTGNTTTQGAYNAATGLWNIGTLNDGATATITLTGTVDVGEGGNTITNVTTAATGDQTDPTTAGDDLDEAVVIDNTTDLVTVKTLSSGDATPDEGDTVTFQIEVTNNGSAQATNVSLTDSMPAGITYTGNTTTQGSYNAATGLWNIGTLNDGATATITLTGTVDVGEGGNTITNMTSAATGDQTDPTTAGDDLVESVAVNDASDLVTVKTLTSGDSTPEEGDTVTFQIVVTNNGAAQATNVSLTDSMPAGITYTGNTTTQGAYNAATGLWNIGTLNDGATATITLTGTVDVGEGGNTITNVTTAATGDQTDPTTAGDDLDEAVVIDNTTDLVTVKTLASGNATPDEGDTVTFQIVITNNGAAQATNVSLTDSMPTGITYTGNTTTQGAYNAATGLWNIGTLNDGATATITLTGTVDVGEGGNTITNMTSAATGDQTDPSTAGDDLDESVTVNNAADLVTVKTLTSGDSTPAEGDTVTFQIQVTNNGAAQATSVSLTDSLPAGLTYTGNTTTQGAYNAATGLWNIGTLNDGATATIMLTGTVDVGQGGQTITNITTAATGDQTDPSTVGDDLEEEVVVEEQANLVTVKTLASGTSTPAEGDTVTFEIEVTNNGPNTATNVSLTDLLPAGLTATAANGGLTQGTYNSTSGLWTIGTLANGASATLTLEGTVDAGSGGVTITNITTAAAGDQLDPTTVGDDLTESVGSINDAELVTVKTLASGDATPDEGDTVTFQIQVSNNGAAQATNVSLTDSLPAGITYTGNTTTQGSYNAATGLWTVGTLNNGTTATITLTGTVDVGEGGNTITNITTAASGDQPDPSTAGDDLEEAIVVNDAADLVTVKTLASADATPAEGDTVTFQIQVTNNGAAQATSVSLTDSLPAGITYTGNTTTQGAYNAATGLWNIGTLNDGAVATITLTGTVDVGEGGNTITNVTTAATGDQMDPTTAGDDLDEAVVIDNTTDLVTVKTLASGDATPDEGDTVTFQIQVTNNGAAQATNVSLTDSMPAGITYTGNTTTQGAYNAATGLWNIGTLNDGATATITLTGTVDVGEGGNTITNMTTAATGDQPDPTTVGDDLEESVTVNDASDLVTVKTLASGDATPDEGDTVTFQIVVTNNGAAQATNVSLTDSMPAGITYTGNTTTQGAYNAATGLWTIGTLNDGATATITLTGTVDVGEGGSTITNVTTAATGDQMDPTTVGDDLDEAVVIDNTTDLVTVKTLASGDATPDEGDTVTFEIEVTNNGAAQATNVSLSDSMPAGITYTGNTTTQGTYNAATGLWTIGTLNDGATATITLTGTVDVGEGGNTITNITTAATGDQPDPSTVGDDLDEEVVVNNAADLVTVKTLASGDNTPAEGDTVTFQIEVTNNGAAQATNISLTDSMPAGITYTGNTTSQGTYSVATGLWTIGTLNNGATATITLSGTVDVGQGGNTITNVTTAATGDQPDPSTVGDDLTESIGSENLADLVTVKTLASGDSTPDEGDTVTFEILVANNGAAQATNVSLTDSLPAGITYTGNTTTQGSYNTTTGLWTVGTLSNGATATITLTGTVDVGEGGNTITNVTTAATGDQDDPSTAGDDLVESIVINDAADLVTVKTLASADATPAEGDTVTFQIVVTNNGAAQATNVSLTDSIPAGISYTGNTTSQGAYNAATGLWTIGTLNDGASATITLTGTVDVGEGGNTITNVTTAATGDQMDPSTAGDDLDEAVVIDNTTDLVTVKTLASGDATPEEGDTVTFEIEVTNNGAAQATNVSLTDSMPAGITYTSNTTSQGAYNAATGLWSIGTLNDGAVATITLTGTVDVGEGGNTITNITTAATGDQPDPSTVGDDLQEAIVVEDATDLVTVKTLASGDATPDEGGTVTFQIVVTNNGAAQATNVSLTDSMPAGITYTGDTTSQGSYNSATGLWTIGTLNNGATATITLTGTVDVGEGGNTITNVTTAATGDQMDPSTAGDDLDEAVVIDNTTDLVTVKTLASGDTTPLEGDTVTFQIEVTNNGAAQATSVSLIDSMPTGITYTGNTTSQGAYNPATGLWTIGTLNDGATATITLTGTVDIGHGGNTITNIATAATGDQPDPSTAGDDLDESVVPVAINVEIGVAKQVAGTPLLLSNGNYEVIYLVAVENTGNVDLANLSLTEDLVSQFGGAFINAHSLAIVTPPSNANSTVTLDSLSWNGSSSTEIVDTAQPSLLAIGDAFFFEFTVEVDSNQAAGVLNNQVTVSGDAVDGSGNSYTDPGSGNTITANDDSDSGADPSGDNNGEPGDSTGSDDPTPLYIPSVGLAKSASDPVPNGDVWDVVFTLVYENNGTVDLTNLTLFDDITAEFGGAAVGVSNVGVQNFAGTGNAPTVNNAWASDTTQSIISGGTAHVGDTFEVVFTVSIDPDAAGTATVLDNQATAGGEALDENGDPLTDPNGDPVVVTDDSDNGIDPNGENGSEDTTDGEFGNDPTPLYIADLAIAKSIVGEPVLTNLGNYVVTYQLVVENTGTVDLTNLSLLEDVSTQFGAPFVNASNLALVSAPSDPGSNVAVDSTGWDGSSSIELMDSSTANTLIVGDSFTISFDVEIDPNLVTDPLENQVSGTGSGVDAHGNPLSDSNGNPLTGSDLSDSGTDTGTNNPGDPGDHGTPDDPTPFDPPAVPLGEISGTVFEDGNNDGIQQNGEGGIAGVVITLTGTDIYGNPVTQSVLTEANGRYAFTGLDPGTYSVTQTQPGGFEDGIDNAGDPSITLANDQHSNIQLGFGQSVESGTFAEIQPASTASGNPAQLPPLTPFFNTPIGNLFSSFTGSPGPIYSGIPINSNADPLSLESGRSVLGGYSSNGMSGEFVEGDCGCPEPINPCCEPVDPCGQLINNVESVIVPGSGEAFYDDGCGCGPELPQDQMPVDAMLMGEALVPTEADGEMSESDANPTNGLQDFAEGNSDADSSSTRVDQADSLSFLKRFSNWLKI